MEQTLKAMCAKPVIQELARETESVINELGNVDGTLEMVAAVMIAFDRINALKTPRDWWQP